MTAASRTWTQLTLLALDSVISSPGSPDGPSRYGSPEFPTTPTSGPDRVRASHSPPPAAAGAPPTSATCGPSGSGSSASADLQSSLESRLRAELAGHGSELFALTWKARDMPSEPPICALRASARRMSGSGCSSWPTTAARDWKSSASNKHNDNARPLNEVARLASWPTARATDGGKGVGEKIGVGQDLPTTSRLASWPTPTATREGAYQRRNGDPNQECPTLTGTSRLASWSTPAAHEAGGTPERFLERKREAIANGAQLGVSLTSLSLQAQLADHGQTLTGSPAPTAARGQLSPEHSRWLMGYPVAWADAAPTATRSSRRSRRRSSAPRLKR